MIGVYSEKKYRQGRSSYKYQMEDQRNKFAPYPLPLQEGNMNGWLIDDANDSDLESTACNQPMSLTMEDIVAKQPPKMAMVMEMAKENNGCTKKDFWRGGLETLTELVGAVTLNRWIDFDLVLLFGIVLVMWDCTVSTLSGLFIWFYIYLWNWNGGGFTPKSKHEVEDDANELGITSMVGADHAWITNSINFIELAKLVPYFDIPGDKRKLDNNNQAQQQSPKRQNVALAYARWGMVKRMRCWNSSIVQQVQAAPQWAMYCKVRELQEGTNEWIARAKDQNMGNQAEGTGARGLVHALGGGEADQDLNDMEDDISVETLFL
ncbi:hypothetical protein Tco_1571541 [Tanacetum coccineum]